MNGNWVYFMSCRKLTGEPSRSLSWKKMILSYAACLLFQKNTSHYSFLRLGGKKEDIFSNYQVQGPSSFQNWAFFLFSGAHHSNRSLPAQTGWWREGERATRGLERPCRGPLGQRSAVWRGAHTLGNFLNGRKEQLSSKTEPFPHSNILAYIFMEVTSYRNENFAKQFNTEQLCRML